MASTRNTSNHSPLWRILNTDFNESEHRTTISLFIIAFICIWGSLLALDADIKGLSALLVVLSGIGVPLAILTAAPTVRRLYISNRYPQQQELASGLGYLIAACYGYLFHTFVRSGSDALDYISQASPYYPLLFGLPVLLYAILLTIAYFGRGKFLDDTAEEKLAQQLKEMHAARNTALRELVGDAGNLAHGVNAKSWEYRLRQPAWYTFWVCLGVMVLGGLLDSLAGSKSDSMNGIWDVGLIGANLGFMLILLTRWPGSTTWHSPWLSRRFAIHKILYPLCWVCVVLSSADELANLLGFRMVFWLPSNALVDAYIWVSLALMAYPAIYVFGLTREIAVLKKMPALAPDELLPTGGEAHA